MKREHANSCVWKGIKMFEIKEVKEVKTGLKKVFYESSFERMKDCHPLTKIAGFNMIAFLNENAEKIGGTAFITQGYRTVEHQKRLYAQGRTAPGKIVTQLDGVNKISKHQTGLAFDIAVYKEGKLDWSPETWQKVLFEMKKFKVLFEMKYNKYELILGGEWKKFKDLPHVEIRKRKEVE